VQRTCAAILGAVTLVAAPWLSGCSDDSTSAPSPTPFSQSPTVSPPTTEAGAPLPPAATLTDLMGRLADPNVAGTDKIGLVQLGTPADAVALDRFTKALHDSGYAPLTFEATDMMWAQDQPGNVIANITMKPGGPQTTGKDMKFPMEFAPQQDTWQLTRQTADLLLQTGQLPTATAPPPTPTG
jgi:hypothetical protein